MISKWTPPDGHPLDEKKAKELQLQNTDF